MSGEYLSIFEDLIKPPYGKTYCAFLSQSLVKSFLDYLESNLVREDEDGEEDDSDSQ